MNYSSYCAMSFILGKRRIRALTEEQNQTYRNSVFT